MKAVLLENISHLIQEVMGNDEIKVTLTTSAEDVSEWDSMSHLELISAIESKYQVRFALGELQAMQNVGDMIELLEKKLS